MSETLERREAIRDNYAAGWAAAIEIEANLGTRSREDIEGRAAMEYSTAPDGPERAFKQAVWHYFSTGPLSWHTAPHSYRAAGFTK